MSLSRPYFIDVSMSRVGGAKDRDIEMAEISHNSRIGDPFVDVSMSRVGGARHRDIENLIENSRYLALQILFIFRVERTKDR